MIKICDQLARCYEKLSGIVTPEIIGRSALNREILCFHFGQEPRLVLFGGIHAREWITVLLLTELAIKEGKGLDFDLVPCLNPDGMCLCLDGLKSVRESDREFLLKVNGSEDFSGWKANARAVDLNVNFDADWGEGFYNVTEPAAANFIGRSPMSECETHAAARLLRRNYSVAVSYHSLGEEVYWGYEYNFRHYTWARAYADKVGYKLKRSERSTGGLKDFYSLNYAGLGLTVEVGKDAYGHPYPMDKLDELISRHEGSLTLLHEISQRITYDGLYERGDKGGKKSL